MEKALQIKAAWLSLLVFYSCMICNGQDFLSKWQKAIINIEGHAQYESSFWEKIIEGQRNIDSLKNAPRGGMFSGTAIFFKDDSSHFLITARHVLIDKAQYDALEKKQQSWENYSMSVFSKILLIPSVENVELYLRRPPQVLMNLQAGSRIHRPYVISDTLDLAIINLSYPGKGPRFLKSLIDLGYEPITVNDIDFENSLEVGSDIVCLGFPTSMSKIEGIGNVDSNSRRWMLDYTSLPVVSFGKIAQSHKKLDRFLGDVSIYPGNSGGPVLCKGKLIGIVSEQPTIPLESSDPFFSNLLETRIPFAYFVKIGPFKQLLAQMNRLQSAFKKSLLPFDQQNK